MAARDPVSRQDAAGDRRRRGPAQPLEYPARPAGIELVFRAPLMRKPVPFMAAAAFAAAMLSAAPSFARAITIENPVAKVTFSDTGEYAVHCLGRWSLHGKLGDRPGAVTSRAGTDGLGAWREVQARTPAEVAEICVYQKEPVVLFRERRIQAGRNLHVFPDFATLN